MKKTILVVDDDRNLLQGLQRVLRKKGYSVMMADNAVDGLRLTEETKPALIVLDLQMPGMSGVTFFKEICDENGHPRFPVLVFSGRANMDVFFANLNVEGFVQKPCATDELLAKIESIVRPSDDREDISDPVLDAGRKKALLVEDDSDVRTRLADGLRRLGLDVATLGSGADAVERIVLTKPDMVILKRTLSGMNGVAIADILRRIPSIQNTWVFLYGYDEPSALELRLGEQAGNTMWSIHGSATTDVAGTVSRILRRSEP
jgi:DNA-binding response OmpR family regulator